MIMSDKDQLVSLNESQKDPYKAQGSDFPVKTVAAGTGQSGAAGSSSGKDALATQSSAQESPRSLESASLDGPSEWGKGGKAFSVGQNDEGGQSVNNPNEVDLKDGSISCKGYTQTVVDEVPDPSASAKIR
jgi:hypothetical protein